jgi:hypothetical protein
VLHAGHLCSMDSFKRTNSTLKQTVLRITHSAAPATRASPTGIRAALKISPGVMSLRLALCATAK